MEPEELQKAWQSQAAGREIHIDTDLLLHAVQLKQQELRAVRCWDDLSEIGISLAILPMWIYLGVTTESPLMWYLMVPVLIWSIGLTLVVRARQKAKPSEPDEPLLTRVNESLRLVEQQIWWSRYSFWWRQLPTAIAMLAFVATCAWVPSNDVLDALRHAGLFVFYFVFLSALYAFMYYVNQRVIRTRYEPQRRELLTLLASLQDETTGEVRGEYPILMSEQRAKRLCSPRRRLITLVFAIVCFVVLLAIGVAIFHFAS